MKARRTTTSEKRMLGAVEEKVGGHWIPINRLFMTTHTNDVIPSTFTKAYITQTYTVRTHHIRHIQYMQQFYMRTLHLQYIITSHQFKW